MNMLRDQLTAESREDYDRFLETLDGLLCDLVHTGTKLAKGERMYALAHLDQCAKAARLMNAQLLGMISNEHVVLLREQAAKTTR